MENLQNSANEAPERHLSGVQTPPVCLSVALTRANQVLDKALREGRLSVNECRAIRGLEPLPGNFVNHYAIPTRVLEAYKQIKESTLEDLYSALDRAEGRRERLFLDRQIKWSKETFPDGSVLGALYHLSEEGDEAIEACEAGDVPSLRLELADCRALVDSAVWRAGITRDQHNNDREAKQSICEQRTWVIGEDGVGRHVKSAEEAQNV